MSDMFKLPNERVNPNARLAVQRDPDVFQGFKTSANNNQPREAMQYLIHIIEVLSERIEACECKCAENAKPAPATTKKQAAAAAKDEPEE